MRSENGRIADVFWTEASPQLPKRALLPATVNLHTHLELSGVRTPVGSGLPLDRWVEEVIRFRTTRGQNVSEADAVATGFQEMTAAGSGAVLDIAQSAAPTSTDEAICVSAYEVLGLDTDRSLARLQSVLDRTEGRPDAISPHAPYSTHPDTRDQIVRLSAERGVLVTTHLAESPAERQLLERGDGPFAELLKRLGVWQDGLFGGRSIADELTSLLSAHRLVVAHGNDLRPDEYERLAIPTAAVAYCPRTHAFFGYGQHPVHEMLKRG